MNRIRSRRCIANVRSVAVAALLVYLVAVVVAPLQAVGLGGSGDPFEIFFDENGNGQISVNGGPLGPIHGVMAPDPADAGHVVLTYFLPEHVVNGDVAVFEPDSTQQILSDGLRFTDANGNLDHFSATADRMIYLSETGDADKADTGFGNFGLVTGFNGTVPEVGPENNNGFDWFPGGNIYHGISDVPEPGTVILLGIGMLGMGLYRWRRHRKAA